MTPPSRDAGFTLIEVVVALGILAFVVLTFLGSRTEAIIDASEARNWRLAREIAEEVLSELQAGARDLPPEPQRVEVDDYPKFSYQILVGEAQIGDHQSAAIDNLSGGDQGDRMAWQQERDDVRLARQKGLTLSEYRDDQLREEYDLEQDDQTPTEDDIEDVMVIVYFPEVRPREDFQPEATFKLRAKISTMAIEGLTPDEADDLARVRGEEPASSDPGGPQ